MSDDSKLVESLRTVASEYWRPDSPIYLSNIPRILIKSLPDFRDILGERSLKTFAKATEGEGGYRVVEHHAQRSKVVLVPADKDFEFPVEDSPPAEEAPQATARPASNSRSATLAFLTCVSQLPDEQTAQIVIPTWILAKLLQK